MKYLAKAGLCGTLMFSGVIWPGGAVRGDEPVKPDYSGMVRATYDYRGLGSDSDQDAYGYWSLRGRNLADGQIDLYTSGRIQSDLDGSGSSYADDPFIGLDDTSRNDHIRLLQLYAEWHDKARRLALRGGRQYVDIADYIQMDGLQAMFFEQETIGGRLFFGQPSSYYSSVSGDLFGGVSVVGRPWAGNRSRATYARYEQDSVSAADDHYFFDMQQQVTEELRGRAYLSVLNEDVRMGGADLFFMSLEEKVFDASVGVRRWGDYDAHTRAYSPLVQALGEQSPYTTGYGRLTTQVASAFYLSPGVLVKYPDDTDPSNEAFEKYDITFIYEPSKSVDASISAEYWDVHNDDRFFGLSGDLRYRYERVWEVSLGAAYLDYTYNEFSDFSLTADGGSTIVGQDGTRVEVSPYAFTYYLRGRWNLNEYVALRLAGEIEDDSDEADLGYRVRTSVEVRL